MNVRLEIPTLHSWRAVPQSWSTVVCTTMILVLCCSSWLLAATSTPGSAASVAIDGQPLFTIHTGLANIDPTARAQAIEKRLARLRESPASVIESLTVEDHEATSYIVTSHEVLFVVTEAEAKAAGRPRQELAREQAEKIRARNQHQPVAAAVVTGCLDMLADFLGKTDGILLHGLD